MTFASKDSEIYSEDTDRTYRNFDALVEAEAHGYTVVLTSARKGTVPWVVGLHASKAEADKARIRARRKAVRAEHPHKVTTHVRVVWKEDP
jgi:hypothetical protein